MKTVYWFYLTLLTLSEHHIAGIYHTPAPCMFLTVYPTRRGYCDKPVQLQTSGGCNDVYKRLPQSKNCNGRDQYYLYHTTRPTSRGFIYTNEKNAWVLGTNQCDEAFLHYNYPCGERSDHCMLKPWDRRWDTGLVVTCETCDWVRLREFIADPLASDWYMKNGTCSVQPGTQYTYPLDLYHTMSGDNRLYMYYVPQDRNWVVSRERCNLKNSMSIFNSFTTLSDVYDSPWPDHVSIYCSGQSVTWDSFSKVLYTSHVPWQHLPVPKPLNEITPLVKLYTRVWLDHPILMNFDKMLTLGIKNSLGRYMSVRGGIMVQLMTVFIVHGMGDSLHSQWQDEMARAIITRMGTANIAVVGWGDGAPKANYPLGATNTRVIAEFISLLMIELLNAGSDSSSIWCIGHDFGAHACGMAGQRVKEVTGLSILRITGLDPSGPLFETHDPKTRLNSDDAEYVDVIHTQGRVNEGGMPAMGTMKPMGHDDFYPEAGFSTREMAIDLMLSSLEQRFDCMYVQHTCKDAWQIPQSCERITSKIVMGYYSIFNRDPNNKRRLLYVDISKEKPYCTINRS